MSADTSDEVLSSGTETEIRNVGTSGDSASSINYWLFILAVVLLAVLWMCCACWVSDVVAAVLSV